MTRSVLDLVQDSDQDASSNPRLFTERMHRVKPVRPDHLHEFFTGTRAPWLAIIVLAIAWASCLGLGFERLVTLDVLLYGGSLVLEFLALAVLRFSAPELPRPFRVPGGLFGATSIGIAPMLLLGFSVVHGASQRILGMNALLFGAAIIAAGFAAYYIGPVSRRLAERKRISKLCHSKHQS